MHHVYILLTETGKYYTGYTTDLDKRIEAHFKGTASKFTRANKPVHYVYTMGFKTKSEALREEYRIKRLSRKQKEELIRKNRPRGTA